MNTYKILADYFKECMSVLCKSRLRKISELHRNLNKNAKLKKSTFYITWKQFWINLFYFCVNFIGLQPCDENATRSIKNDIIGTQFYVLR